MVGLLWLLHTPVLQCRILRTAIQDIVGLVRHWFVRPDQIPSRRSVFTNSLHRQADVFFPLMRVKKLNRKFLVRNQIAAFGLLGSYAIVLIG